MQCGVDSRDATEQTIRIKSKTRWSQHPPTQLRVVGNGDGTFDDEDDVAVTAQARQAQSDLLGRFLEKAAGVCVALLEESTGLLGGAATQPSLAQAVFADHVTQLAAGLPVFAGRQVVAAEYSAVRPHLLLVAYGSCVPGEAQIVDPDLATGCLCLWNTREPSSPLNILVTESTPTCCCFDPRKACLAFAATEEGSVAVWDLREPAGLHSEHSIAGTAYRLRRPTYSTDGIPSTLNHEAPVVAIASVSSASAGTPKGQSSASPTTSFQLATLDLDGVFKTWTVVEEVDADAAGSLSALGLLPGGRVKIVPGATVVLTASPRSLQGDSLQATCFQLFPERPNQFIAGTSLGGIVRGVRFGERHSPRQYLHSKGSLLRVCSMRFHPTVPTHFLAGYSNGDVCLFHVDFAAPIETWIGACDSEVRWVRWSTLRPTVFFALTASGKLVIWDLLESSTAPVETIDVRGGRDGTQTEVVAVTISEGAEYSELALAYHGGSIECYYLNERFTIAEATEQASIEQFLQSVY